MLPCDSSVEHVNSGKALTILTSSFLICKMRTVLFPEVTGSIKLVNSFQSFL